LLEQRGVDLDAEELHASVDDRRHHAAPRATLRGTRRDLFLHGGEPFLELLGLLEQAAQIEALAHARSSIHGLPSRTPRTSAPKISTAACTSGSARVSSSRRRACAIGVSPARSAGSGPTSTRSGRPATSVAMAARRARVSLPVSSRRIASLSMPRRRTAPGRAG